jgi:hypothetical protein
VIKLTNRITLQMKSISFVDKGTLLLCVG